MIDESLVQNIVVIIVEDEMLIRMSTAEDFSDAGFEVLEAENVQAALIILEAEASRLHVLFTDVHMPGELTGVHLAHHACKRWPWIGLLVTSGQPKPADNALPKGCRFIAKPYDTGDVVQHVRDLAAAA